MDQGMGAELSTTLGRADGGDKGATGEWLLRFDDGEPVRSLNSRFAVNICFCNLTSSPVEVVWVNFKGQENSYGPLAPGKTSLLHSYLGHAWVLRGAGRALGDLVVHGQPVVFPSASGSPLLPIVEAPRLAWSPRTHPEFRNRDPAFGVAVQNLLRLYHAQRRDYYSGTTSRKDSSGGGGAWGYSGGHPHHPHHPYLQQQQQQQEAAANNRTGWAGSAQKRQVAGGRGVYSAHGNDEEDCDCCGSLTWLGTAALLPFGLTYEGLTNNGNNSDNGNNNNGFNGTNGNCNGAPDHPAYVPASGPTLGRLPADVVLHIIQLMAPSLPAVRQLSKYEVQTLPPAMEPHRGPRAYLAARLLGPEPPQVPVAALAEILRAGAGPGGMAAAAAAPAGAANGAAAAQDPPGPLALAAAAAAAAAAAPAINWAAVLADMLGAAVAAAPAPPPAGPGVARAAAPGSSSAAAVVSSFVDAQALAHASLVHVGPMGQQQQAQFAVLLEQLYGPPARRQQQQQQQPQPQQPQQQQGQEGQEEQGQEGQLEGGEEGVQEAEGGALEGGAAAEDWQLPEVGAEGVVAA